MDLSSKYKFIIYYIDLNNQIYNTDSRPHYIYSLRISFEVKFEK
jgi:hypothetical protein